MAAFERLVQSAESIDHSNSLACPATSLHQQPLGSAAYPRASSSESTVSNQSRNRAGALRSKTRAGPTSQ